VGGDKGRCPGQRSHVGRGLVGPPLGWAEASAWAAPGPAAFSRARRRALGCLRSPPILLPGPAEPTSPGPMLLPSATRGRCADRAIFSANIGCLIAADILVAEHGWSCPAELVADACLLGLASCPPAAPGTDAPPAPLRGIGIILVLLAPRASARLPCPDPPPGAELSLCRRGAGGAKIGYGCCCGFARRDPPRALRPVALLAAGDGSRALQFRPWRVCAGVPIVGCCRR